MNAHSEFAIVGLERALIIAKLAAALRLAGGFMTIMLRAFPALALMLGCDQASELQADVERGKQLLWQYGCGACHRIEGVTGAQGNVGPPLDDIGKRVYLAGVLPNSRENLVRWIMSPQKFSPLSAMPDMRVTEVQARDMTAYLYRKRREE